jgi:N-methylhydantoinase A
MKRAAIRDRDLWLAVDVGGTFTDLALYEVGRRRLRLAKVPSTPADLAAAVLAGIRKLKVDLARVSRLIHGTTIATNAILTRSGARVGVLTTAGARDVLEIGRGQRGTMYDLRTLRIPPLVPRERRLEIPERLAADGTTIRPLDEAAVGQALGTCAADGIESLAICFLHAYANPAHERRAAELAARRLPGVPVSCSADILPEYKEYERFSTTVLNAYIVRTVDAYLARLEAGLAGAGFRGQLMLLNSSGGTIPVDRARQVPVHLILSGPAGGVSATVHVARRARRRHVIAYDMGGTSTEAGLVRDLRPTLASEGQIAGFPNKTPQLELTSIGAGGGSIAWLDLGGELRVGPRSAGADPGPAAYGRGGTEPTVTDAHVVLGTLDPGRPLGGEVPLHAARAEEAVRALGQRLGLDAKRMAEGIVRVAVARMVSAIKEISIAKGHDPRDYTLVAFGGAGPMHAGWIARELGIHEVLVPPGPGNFSALGGLLADLRYDAARTWIRPTRGLAASEVEAGFQALEASVRKQLLDQDGWDPARVRLGRHVGMRYRRQMFEVAFACPRPLHSATQLERAFARAYRERYAYIPPEGEAEIVSLRLVALGLTPKPALRLPAEGASAPRRRPAFLDGRLGQVPVLGRASLPGRGLAGPAIIEEEGATTVLLAGFRARTDAEGNLRMTRIGRRPRHGGGG